MKFEKRCSVGMIFIIAVIFLFQTFAFGSSALRVPLKFSKIAEQLVKKANIKVVRNSQFKRAYQPVTAIPDDLTTETSVVAAAVLTHLNLRGAAIGLDKKNPEQKAEIARIKDVADGTAKDIYQRAIEKEGYILYVHASEGFGRDGVENSFKSNEVVNPSGSKGEKHGIMDVIDGTNKFVINAGNKKLSELDVSESGAVSIIVTGDAVKSLGNCFDGYLHSIITTVPPEKRHEFTGKNALDPELIAKDPRNIEKILLRIAEANNIGIGDLEVILMNRDRETKNLEALAELSKKYAGLKITTIEDGTVAPALKATFGAQGEKHKVIMTVGGAPEGFYNLVAASVFKDEGALASARIYSARMNETADGGKAVDMSRRYDFDESEIVDMKSLREDAEAILKGEKLFTQDDIKGDAEGSMAFITNNGVFGVSGAEKLQDSRYKVKVLRFGKISGKPCAWFEEKIVEANSANVDFKLADSKLSAGYEIKKSSYNELVNNKSQASLMNGRILSDALKSTYQGKQSVIMATNIRSPLSLPGIIAAAKKTNSVVVFQQATSELGYTWPSGKGHEVENARAFAAEVKAICRELGFYDYIIKADHVTVTVDKPYLTDNDAQKSIETLFDRILAQKDNSARMIMFKEALNDKDFNANPNVASTMKMIKARQELVVADVEEGMTIFALDASFMPVKSNIRVTAFLAGFIPNVTCVLEGEVGEIGGQKNSTVADALEFVTGVRYAEDIKKDENGAEYSEIHMDQVLSVDKGLLDFGVILDRMAINNGTSHGNNYDKDGNLIVTKMNLKMTAAISEAIAPYGIEIVQHGITGTPLQNLPALRAAGVTEGHVGTNWQNIIWDVLTKEYNTSPEVKEVVDSMIAMLVKDFGSKYGITDIATADPKKLEQMIGKELKFTLGSHKARLAALPESVKEKINIATEKDAAAHLKAFGANDTAKLVREFVNIPNPSKLMGGRNFVQIAGDLAGFGKSQELLDMTIVKEEFFEYNAQGGLADFLANLAEKDPKELNLSQDDISAGIDKVLSGTALKRAESEDQDMIMLPASKISKLDKMQVLADFLATPDVQGKTVVIVSANKDDLSAIRDRFLQETGKKLEELVWLKVLEGRNLESLESIYDQLGLDIQCTLEKVQDRNLADAIKRGV